MVSLLPEAPLLVPERSYQSLQAHKAHFTKMVQPILAAGANGIIYVVQQMMFP